MSFFEWKMTSSDAGIIGYETRRLTWRRNPFERNSPKKQHRRAIPLARKLRKLFPDVARDAVIDLYKGVRKAQWKINAAEREEYEIGPAEAEFIGAFTSSEMLQGTEKGLFMAEKLFQEMPCTFLAKLIKSRESSEIWLAVQVERKEEQDNETLEEIAQNHNALLALKIMREKINWANEEKRFYKALKQIQ